VASSRSTERSRLWTPPLCTRALECPFRKTEQENLENRSELEVKLIVGGKIILEVAGGASGKPRCLEAIVLPRADLVNEGRMKDNVQDR
jgi:hypothetical protein